MSSSRAKACRCASESEVYLGGREGGREGGGRREGGREKGREGGREGEGDGRGRGRVVSSLRAKACRCASKYYIFNWDA